MKDGRALRIGSEAELEWIAEGATYGRAITSAIPPLFESYATLELPGTPGAGGSWSASRDDINEQREQDENVVSILRAHTTEAQPWWLGYLETGIGAETVFWNVPTVSSTPTGHMCSSKPGRSKRPAGARETSGKASCQTLCFRWTEAGWSRLCGTITGDASAAHNDSSEPSWTIPACAIAPARSNSPTKTRHRPGTPLSEPRRLRASVNTCSQNPERSSEVAAPRERRQEQQSQARAPGWRQRESVGAGCFGRLRTDRCFSPDVNGRPRAVDCGCLLVREKAHTRAARTAVGAVRVTVAAYPP